MPDIRQAIAWEVQLSLSALVGIAAMQLLTERSRTRNLLSGDLSSSVPLFVRDVAQDFPLEVNHVVPLS
jgi:hypothetical protein